MAVQLALERLDGIEASLAASIDRFADTVSKELCDGASPRTDHLGTATTKPVP